MPLDPAGILLLFGGILSLVQYSLLWPLPGANPARLLRVPKVYNALITSDEPLLPSRAEQATVGQVLYYPPAQYPASSVPLVLPHAAGAYQQIPGQPLHRTSSAQLTPISATDPQLQAYQRQVSLPQQPSHFRSQDPDDVQYQRAVQEAQVDYYEDDVGNPQAVHQVAPQPAEQSPVVYAPTEAPNLAPHQAPQSAPQMAPQASQSQFPASRASQTVERVTGSLVYQPPPSVHIDSIKNNRPNKDGIPDVPPPPLPVGRRTKQAQQGRPQPPPPGLGIF